LAGRALAWSALVTAACSSPTPPPVPADGAVVARWTQTRLSATLGVHPPDDIARALRAFLALPAVAGAQDREAIERAWDGAPALAGRSPDLPEWVFAEAREEAGWAPDRVPEAACAAGFRAGVGAYLEGR
jgi:hypothetical protein